MPDWIHQAPTLDGLPQVLVPNHLFVVDQVQNVATADGEQCALSVGDVIKLTAAPPEGAATADLTVLSSRKGDCASGLTVTLPLESLQEMQNNFRAQLDSGLQALRDQAEEKSDQPTAAIHDRAHVVERGQHDRGGQRRARAR